MDRSLDASTITITYYKHNTFKRKVIVNDGKMLWLFTSFNNFLWLCFCFAPLLLVFVGLRRVVHGWHSFLEHSQYPSIRECYAFVWKWSFFFLCLCFTCIIYVLRFLSLQLLQQCCLACDHNKATFVRASNWHSKFWMCIWWSWENLHKTIDRKPMIRY